jgi:hypothetical protein
MQNEISSVAGGGDVKECQLISALFVVSRSDFNWISSIPKLDKVDAFDHSAASHVKTWNDSFG